MVEPVSCRAIQQARFVLTTFFLSLTCYAYSVFIAQFLYFFSDPR